MLKSGIKFDRLDIWHCCGSNVDMAELCDLLNRLYEQGFYMNLHFHNNVVDGLDVLHRITLVRGCELLALDGWRIDWTSVPPLPNLKEFMIDGFEEGEESERLAKALTNVRRINLGWVSSNIVQN